MKYFFFSLTTAVLASSALVALAGDSPETLQKTFVAYKVTGMEDVSETRVYKGAPDMHTQVTIRKRPDLECHSGDSQGADDGETMTFNVEGDAEVYCRYNYTGTEDKPTQLVEVTYEPGKYEASYNDVNGDLHGKLQEAKAKVEKMDFASDGELVKFLTKVGAAKDGTSELKVPANKLAGGTFTVGADEVVILSSPSGTVGRNKTLYAKQSGKIGPSGIAEADLRKYGLYKGVNKILLYKDKNPFELVCEFTPSDGGPVSISNGMGQYGAPGAGRCVVNGSKSNFANYQGGFSINSVSFKKEQTKKVLDEMIGSQESAKSQLDAAKTKQMQDSLAKMTDQLYQDNYALAERFHGIQTALNRQKSADEKRLQTQRDQAADLQKQIDDLTKTELEKAAERKAQQEEALEKARLVTDALFQPQFSEKLVRTTYVATLKQFKYTYSASNGQKADFVAFNFEQDHSVYYTKNFGGVYVSYFDDIKEFPREIVTGEPWGNNTEWAVEKKICTASLPTLHQAINVDLKSKSSDLTAQSVLTDIDQLTTADHRICNDVADSKVGARTAWFTRGKNYSFCWQPTLDERDEGPMGVIKYVKLVPLNIVATYVSKELGKSVPWALPNSRQTAIPSHPFFKSVISTNERWRDFNVYDPVCVDAEVYTPDLAP